MIVGRKWSAFLISNEDTLENLDTKQFIMTMRQIAEEKNLPFEIVQEALEQALAAAYRKDYGNKDQNIRVSLNPNSGEFKIFVVHEIVEEVENPEAEVALAEVKKTDKNAKVGQTIEAEVRAEDFGRVAAQTAKQVILQKLREAERDVVYAEYSGRIGTILNGSVQRVEPRVVYIDLGKAQGILPLSEQIPGEHYSGGQRLRVYLRDVETSARGPQLVLSRANADLVSQLFEKEVPELENKAVEIKEIAREAGVRTKVAVATSVPGVDPVGTFVGGHGTRVQAVMSELSEEKIDIIPYSDDPKTFITSALSPTTVNKVTLDTKENKATVEVNEDQLSIAIGKNGQNVRIASKLTGWQIDIVSPSGDRKESSEPAKAKPKERKPASKADLEASLIASVDESAKATSSSGQSENSEKAAEASSKSTGEPADTEKTDS